MTVDFFSSMIGKEDIMLKVLAQRGPLGVNVNSIQWHDYIGEVFSRKFLVISLAFQFLKFGLRQSQTGNRATQLDSIQFNVSES